MAGIGERKDKGNKMAAMEEMNKLCQPLLVQKKARRRWTWIAPSADSKNEMDYVLVDARRVVKDISVVPSLGSDHPISRARIHLITAT